MTLAGRLRRILRRADRRIRAAGTPKELVAAFDWFRTALAALVEGERRRGRFGGGDVLP